MRFEHVPVSVFVDISLGQNNSRQSLGGMGRSSGTRPGPIRHGLGGVRRIYIITCPQRGL